MQHLSTETPYAQMTLTDIPGVPLTVQVPSSFESLPVVDGALAGVDARRTKPPVDVPHVRLTYEGFVDVGDETQGRGKLAYNMYVAVAELSNAQSGDYTRLAFNQLRGVFAGATVHQEDVYCTTPTGRSTRWKKIWTEAPHGFYYVGQDGNSEFRSTEAAIEFYVRQFGKYEVLVGWRVPGYLKDDFIKLGERATQVAGSVKLKQ